MDTFYVLLNGLKKIPNIDNGWDRLLYPFNGSFEQDQKRFLGIPADEKVVYVRIIEADKTIPCSLAITDRGIYYRFINKFFMFTTADDTWSVKFEDVDEVQYSEREDSFIFSNGASIKRHNIAKKMERQYYFEFAKILTEVANNVLGKFDFFDNGMKLYGDEKYEDALLEFDKAQKNASQDPTYKDSDDRAHFLFMKGVCYLNLEQDKEAKEHLLLAKDIVSKSSDNEVQELYSSINFYLAFCSDNRIESHKLLVEAYYKAIDDDKKIEIISNLRELHKAESFKNKFNSADSLSERKVILVQKDNSIPVPGQNLLCLERKVLNALGTSFPIGHPVEGNIYMAHPTRINYYIPQEQYEESLFIERVHEYCYLLRCLGAKEIIIRNIVGKSIEEIKSSANDASVFFQRKIVGVDVNGEYKNKQETTSFNSYEFNSHMVFVPSCQPFVPNDLNWLAIEPKWKRLIENRLEGFLSTYIEEISTSDNCLLSENEETNLAMEIKLLLANFKGQINCQNLYSSSTKKATKWRIEVKF